MCVWLRARKKRKRRREERKGIEGMLENKEEPEKKWEIRESRKKIEKKKYKYWV